MPGANLWWATRQPQFTIEEQLRALRLWDYLEQASTPVLYKNIREDMGLTYWQTVRAVGMLCHSGIAEVRQTAKWNGQHWIYPHEVRLTTPVL